LPVEIDREDYSPAWEGVTYEAIYSGRRYRCLIAIHHLKMKTGKDALAEFRARRPEVERATEDVLRLVRAEIDEGRRKPTEKVIVPLGS
jgi:hypothetical protein